MTRERLRSGRGAALLYAALIVATGAHTAHATTVLHLSGGGDGLQVDDSPYLRAAEALTISLWMRASHLKDWQGLIWKGDLPDRSPWSNREFGIFLNGSSVHLTSTPATRVYRGHLYLNSPRGTVHVGRWQHVAAVVTSDADGGSMRLFVDGELIASRPYEPGGVRDSSGPLRIGGIANRGYAFAGDIDEVRLWNRALDDDEIRTEMARARRGDEPGLIAYYPFDGATQPGWVFDHSPYGHHARIRGTAQVGMSRGAMLAVAAAPVVVPSAAATTTTTTTSAGGTTTTTTTTPSTVLPVAPIAVVPAAAAPILVQSPAQQDWISGAEADLLIESLDHHDPQVRRAAVRRIGQLAPPWRADAMEQALGSHDSIVRRHAARLFGELDEPHSNEIPVSGVADVPNAVLTMSQPSPAPVPTPVHAHVDHRRYHDWEHKWSAEGPDFWGLEQEGVLARYNRAEGLFLGWRQARDYQSPWGVANYGEIGRGLANERWRWQAGGELFTWYGPPTRSSHLATVGVEAHDLTDSEDGWLISEQENSLEAALFRRDYRDVYRRRGGSLYTAHNVGGVLQIGARYQRDRYSSMPTATDWALFDNGWADAAFRDNPEIDAGDVVRARADVQLDTRTRRGHPDRGWFINAFAERAGGVLGGEFRFKRYLLDLRRYQPMGTGTRLDFRLRGGTAKGNLPRQFVYRLGGVGSLRGYGHKSLAGDRSVLLNTQYWIDADRHWSSDLPLDGLGLGLFFDAGAAWFANDRSDPFTGFRQLALGVDTGPEWKRAVGLAVGTSDDGLRLEFARALDDDPGALEPAADGWSMTLRVSRAF